MVTEAGFVRAAAEPMLGGLVTIHSGWKIYLTADVTHLWRLLKWGRTLARHGALRGIEDDPLTPPQVRRLARIARFGARIPPTPDYAAALQEIGPAAIKLGQALSTRPDLVGERGRGEPVAAAGRSSARAVRSDPQGRSNPRSMRRSSNFTRASIRSPSAPPRSPRSTRR